VVIITEKIEINTQFIRLDSFLKLAGMALTGGQAKVVIQGGEVMVDGEICTARGKKLVSGCIVSYNGESAEVVCTID